LALLLYCYATGVFSSRRIQRAGLDSVPVRMICGDTHPDHDTICTFRRENKALLQENFVRVLELAQELKFLQVGQITVAVDGTKVLANAGKHAAVSYEHAGKTIQQLDGEVSRESLLGLSVFHRDCWRQRISGSLFSKLRLALVPPEWCPRLRRPSGSQR
jgi:hypothetical protein